MLRILQRALGAAIFAVIPTLVLCLALLEVGLRLTGREASNSTEGIFEQHGSGYRLRPGISKLSRSPAFSYTVHTDLRGFRASSPGARDFGAGPYVAFLGDSITFANGVDYDDSFVGVFAARARAAGLGVVNLAVGGHRFPEQEAELVDLLGSVRKGPSCVVVVVTSLFAWGIDMEERRVTVKQGYLFDGEAGNLARLRVYLGDASAAYCLLRDGVRGLERRFVPENPRTALGPVEVFSRSGPQAQPAFAARMEARLSELTDRIRRAGATPVYVYMPSSVDLRAGQLLRALGQPPEDYDLDLYRRLLEHHGRRAGVQIVDLVPLLSARQQTVQRLAFALDPHYDAPTNRVIGEALAASILGPLPARLEGPDAP